MEKLKNYVYSFNWSHQLKFSDYLWYIWIRHQYKQLQYVTSLAISVISNFQWIRKQGDSSDLLSSNCKKFLQTVELLYEPLCGTCLLNLLCFNDLHCHLELVSCDNKCNRKQSAYQTWVCSEVFLYIF